MNTSTNRSDSNFQYVTNDSALLDCQENKAVLIDVREFSEFQEGHYLQAINLPASAVNPDDYLQFAKKTIYLICHSGNRAKRIATILQHNGFEDLAIMQTQMERLNVKLLNQTKKRELWSIDRQFRMTLGLLLLIFLFGFYFLSTYFIAIPMILCTGLIITSIIDKCYMRMGIALLPWNKNQKV